MEYKELLKKKNVNTLRSQARVLGIPYISRYKKDELVEKIYSEMHEQLPVFLLWFHRGHVEMLTNLDQIELLKDHDPLTYEDLLEKGILVEDKGQVYRFEKVMEFIDPVREDLNNVIDFNTLAKVVTEVHIAYYGIIEKDKVIDYIFEIHAERIDRKTIRRLLDHMIPLTFNTYEADGYLHDHRLHEIDKRLEVLKTSQNTEYYPITEKLIEHYLINGFIYQGKAFNDFVKVLFPKYTSSMEETIDLLDQLNLMILYGYQPSDYMKFIANTFQITDGQALKKVADACMAFYNDMPQWFLKGYSPNQFASKANQPYIKAQKVGRNDPCPCGSQKKYKHCCLNKERSH